MHTFADIFIVATFTLFNGVVVANHAKAVNAKCFFHFGKIVIKKLFENGEVTFRKLVNAANASTLFFAGNAKRVFATYQKISEVVVPQVSVKTTHGSHIKKFVNLLVDAGNELFLLIITGIKFFADVRHRKQQVVCI